MSEWMWQLGALHQSRGVPYVEENSYGDVMCNLCGTGWMGRHQRGKHFHGSKHIRKYNHVKRLEEEARENQVIEEEKSRLRFASLTARSFEPRIARLGLQRWRDSMQASLYRYIQDNQLGNTEQVLGRLERMERLSLLEIAVLKAHVIDGVIFRSIDEIREQQALDPKFEFSTYLRTQRVMSGCHVIVPNVAQFL